MNTTIIDQHIIHLEIGTFAMFRLQIIMKMLIYSFWHYAANEYPDDDECRCLPFQIR